MFAEDHSRLEPTRFDLLTGWAGDDHLTAFEAFVVSARHMVEKPYPARTLPIDQAALLRVAKMALESPVDTKEAARGFFESHFKPYTICSGPDFLTGYFEPQVEASRNNEGHFNVPVYRQPDDLIELNDKNRPATLPGDYRFGRQTSMGIEEFYDRRAIMDGALDGLGLELCWLRSKVDALFIHVQGSARLSLRDGSTMRITYAAKSGHPYTSLGRCLADQLNVPPSEMTADVMRDWMTNNPDQLDALLAQNRSYIFFREVTNLNPDDGPIAAAKVPLIAGRSLAVDRTRHTFGVPIFIQTEQPLPGSNAPERRLMIAHDTGTAITGDARGDYFSGSGEAAWQIAARIRHKTRFTLLVPIPERSS